MGNGICSVKSSHLKSIASLVVKDSASKFQEFASWASQLKSIASSAARGIKNSNLGTQEERGADCARVLATEGVGEEVRGGFTTELKGGGGGG
jgi:hypothetical protein